MLESIRSCPLCDGRPNKQAFPWEIEFERERYCYYQCGECATVYVDPIPSKRSFARMYANCDYHAIFYSNSESDEYDQSAEILNEFAPNNALVLDYGCGTGGFIQALSKKGFRAVGVEFDKEAAEVTSSRTGCCTYQVQDFFAQTQKTNFDVIHLGDVLEHLPYPTETLKKLSVHLKPRGLFMLEGPLENNPGLVYWASYIFGFAKHLIFPRSVGSGKPTHLFRVNAAQQIGFLKRTLPESNILYWRIYETGWPYSNGGLIKRTIAKLALFMAQSETFSGSLGNRFVCVIRKDPPVSTL